MASYVNVAHDKSITMLHPRRLWDVFAVLDCFSRFQLLICPSPVSSGVLAVTTGTGAGGGGTGTTAGAGAGSAGAASGVTSCAKAATNRRMADRKDFLSRQVYRIYM